MAEHPNDWNERITVAEEMLPQISRLHRNHNVVTSIFGRLLINITAIDIVKSHRYARRAADRELPLTQTRAILEQLLEMNLGTGSVDIGSLATRYDRQGGDFSDASKLREFLSGELAEIADTGSKMSHTDVVLYGFGRIGRLLARILIAREAAYGGVRLRAVVVRSKGEGDLVKRASLLRRDSVHGAFDGTITADEDTNICSLIHI